MTSAQLEIARRVAASPSSRWMEGMRLTDGRIITRAHRWGVLLVAQWDEAQRLVEPGLVDLSTEPVDPLLTDPATLGCLHALACERWGVDAVYPIDTLDGPEWRGVIAGCSEQYVSARIPADITAAFPGQDYVAAVCAALLNEVTP